MRKYQSRAYRHCYWDTGTILANLLAAAAHHMPARIVLSRGQMVGRLLSLDTMREGALTLLALGNAPLQANEISPTVEPMSFETAPLSKTEIDYPAIRAMHEASSLENEAEVVDWCSQALGNPSTLTGSPTPTSKERVIPLQLPADGTSQDSLEAVTQRRGSTRQFSRESISFRQLSTMLDRATRGVPTDFLRPEERPLNDLYLIVHAVQDVAPGAYVFHREACLELLKEGDFRREAGSLGLGQEIPADCSVNVFFLTDLNRVLERFGNPGYRATPTGSKHSRRKTPLTAYAQRPWRLGLTFFDDDDGIFSPHAAGKSVMFLLASGKSVRRTM
jgi:hypothetical protein